MRGMKRGLLLLLVPLFVLTVVIMRQDSPKHSAVRGVILPHHLVAEDMIVEVLASFDSSHIKRIILIGPNHVERGGHTALLPGVNWEIEGERFTLDQERLSELQEEGVIMRDDAAVMAEHAISVPLPFIQDVMPGVKILPIILSENQSIERLQTLGKRLAPDEQTLIIASIDFSHYLSLDQANINDEATRTLISDWDYAGLYDLNSDYLDSSSAMIAFLAAMEAAGAADSQVINHSNSALILGAGYDYTTSYFTMIFR